MLLFYCAYLFYRKPWEQFMKGEGFEYEEQHWDTEF